MRDSGVELLKIIAVILIVISHVVLTLITENEYIPYSDYLKIGRASCRERV